MLLGEKNDSPSGSHQIVILAVVLVGALVLPFVMTQWMAPPAEETAAQQTGLAESPAAEDTPAEDTPAEDTPAEDT
ncbi:MAG: hypothetical protein ACLFTT_17655, partial [Candidatus Hydrogenedentota bacterium]